MRAFIHDYFVRYLGQGTSTGHCWPQVPTCLPQELAIKPVAPVLQLGMEMTPSQLSKVKSYVQLPGKYINVGSKNFLFE